MSLIAAIGHITRDVVAGADPRPGGGVFYATRALAHLAADAHAVAACSEVHRAQLVPPLEAFGLPVTWQPSSTTTAYSFHYEGDVRIMRQEAVGDPWSAEQAVAAAGDAPWVNVCALVRSDFPSATLAALTDRGHQLVIDAQGLVRTPALGPLYCDGDIGDVLRHITGLKLNDEEAEILVGTTDPEALRALDVREAVLTLGSRGSVVVTSDLIERVPAVEIEALVDPTGAGDTFTVAYMLARGGGAEPVEAARSASDVVASFLTGARAG